MTSVLLKAFKGASLVAVALMTPVQIAFIVVMYKKRHTKTFGTPFHVLLTHTAISCIIQSIIKLLIQEPASQGFLKSFFSSFPEIFGRLVLLNNDVMAQLDASFILAIACNRFVALFTPLKYDMIWTVRSALLLGAAFWAFWAVAAVPMAFFYTGFSYTEQGEGLLYWLDNEDLVKPYAMLAMVVSNSSIAITYLIYILIIVRVIMRNMIGNERMSVLLRQHTIAAMFTSLGGVLVMAVVTSQEVVWLVARRNLMSVDLYYTLFDIGLNYNLVSVPVAVLILYKNLRRHVVLQMFCLPDEQKLLHVFTRTSRTANPAS